MQETQKTPVWSPGVRNGNPLQYSCLENSMDRRPWQATVYVVAKNWIKLSNWARMSTKYLSNTFWASTEIILCFLVFPYVNGMYHIDPFVGRTILATPGMNPTWLWHTILFLYCWIQFAKILLRIFTSKFTKPILIFFFVLSAWFWYQGDGGF